MNILFFTHEKSYGGASRALVTLINDLLKNKDNHIYVVVPFKKAKITKELDKDRVTIISCFYSWWEVPTNISYLKKLIYKIAYKLNSLSLIYLTNKIKKYKIDIIHSNTSVIDIGAKVSKKLGIKHIWHFREFTGNHLKFIKKDSVCYKFINDNTDSIIYISKAIKDFYEKNISKKLGVLIYDGVSSEFILEKPKKNLRKNINFLQVATFEENKGQNLVIEAANELVKRGINEFKVIFAGGDPTGYKEYLETIVKNNHLEKNIEFAGFVTDMNKLRHNVEVELMCSPREAFGLVTIEAMLAGNPVIGSNSGATPELIKDEYSGYLYQPNNPNDLSKKMEFFIKNPKIINEMGNNAKSYAISNFLSEKNSKNIISLYKKVLKR